MDQMWGCQTAWPAFPPAEPGSKLQLWAAQQRKRRTGTQPLAEAVTWATGIDQPADLQSLAGKLQPRAAQPCIAGINRWQLIPVQASQLLLPCRPVPVRLRPQMHGGAALEVSVQDAAQAQQGVRKRCAARPQVLQLLQGQQAALQAAHAGGSSGGGVPGKKAKVTQQPGQSPAQLGWGYGGCSQVGFCVHQGDKHVAGVA